MPPSLAARLWILGAVLSASACDGATDAPSSTPALGAAVAGESAAIHQLGDFALYMPATPDGPRAVLVALGGPKTKAIVTGEPFGAPPPAEPELQALGQALRAFADREGVAIIGTSLFGPTALQDGVAGDARILQAIADGAAASGRAELASVPILMFGLSGGAPAASGFTARHPEQVAGLFLKVPLRMAPLTTAAQRDVPTFVYLAEIDPLIDNAAHRQTFAANRAGGALWALATEPGAGHFGYSTVLRNATLEWMETMLRRRVAGSSGRIQPVVAESGWLGDAADGAVSPWGRYRGDRAAASWLPTQGMAERWQEVGGGH